MKLWLQTVNPENPHWEEIKTVPRDRVRINETDSVQVLCKLHKRKVGSNSCVFPNWVKNFDK